MLRSILVVEDSPTQATALSLLLEGAGHEVTVAHSGEEGLRVSEQTRFDVIISDIMMPGPLDGYALCRHVKAGAHPNTPVMLLTSLSDPLDIIRGLESGADNFLTKPYEPEHLLQRIATLLDTKETRGRAKMRMGVEVFFMGREFLITSQREQILDLLISTFEDAVRQNRELRRREEELEAAQQALARYAGTLQARLQQVLASSPAVIYAGTVSPAGALALNWVSPNIAQATGYSDQEATGPDWWINQIHPDDRARVEAECRTTLLTRGTLALEYRIRRRDGTWRWLRDDLRIIHAAAGAPPDVAGAWIDVTIERGLREQVRLAQKMEAVGTLAGGVAHDFNNSLAVIRSVAELCLLDIAPDSPHHQDLQTISAAVDRASLLTRQLLAFGRRQILEPQIIEVNGMLTTTLNMLERIVGADVRLMRRLATEPIVVRADPGQLEQVLMNLCVNARDAMPEGGEIVVMTNAVAIDETFCAAYPWARPGEYLRLTVSDTGEGMDAETQARMFDPFFTTKELGRGTGLGLAVVYGIVKQHGGLIHVYSELGRGSAFRVYLPLAQGEASRPTLEGGADLVLGTERILLAEDDDALRSMMCRLLARLGYTVEAVPDGEAALHALTAPDAAYDLAVVDLVMPKLNGRQVFEQVHQQRPDLPFVFSTGYSPGTSHTEAIQTLPAPVLAKPYGVRALAQLIRQVLDTPSASGA